MDLRALGTMLEAPSPAVLTTYRANGTAVTSPVWFRFVDEHFEIVIALDDVKVRHLERRPECSLVVFEAAPPFRGVRVEGQPVLDRDGVKDARRGIATKYLGCDGGERFTEQRGPGIVLRLSAQGARSWDLSAILPTQELPSQTHVSD
jgi:pyridoxamine 5'-phosphate oxidase-like protein